MQSLPGEPDSHLQALQGGYGMGSPLPALG